MDGEGQKTFILHSPTTDLDEFRNIARAAAPLAARGRVLVNISEVADKAWHIIPDGGSPWHEYTSYNASLSNFFPHPLIAEHLPAPWVADNRKLLGAKAALLDELGLGAAFWGYVPNMLDESFFRAHPHLRGPRVDHPRRSCREAFALCVDLDQTRDMLCWMMAQLKRAVPHLGAFIFKTNDAGAGLCWAGALYTGPNGPAHCRDRDPGRRVADLLETLHRGAEQGGGDVDIHIVSSNFWLNENHLVTAHLPPRTYYDQGPPAAITAGSMLTEVYPIRGMVNPWRLINSMQRYHDPAVHSVFLDCRASYDRACERAATVDKVVQIVADCIARPVGGFYPAHERLRELAGRWAGGENADRVAQALYNMDRAFCLQQQIAPRFKTLYCGVSMRHITRPLVIRPDLLSPDEEGYFLPHVFNIHAGEARMDYIDLHGARLEADPAVRDRLQPALDLAIDAAAVLEDVAAAPDGPWLNELARGMRLWASITRSIANFFTAQLIRDRNRHLLAVGPRIPSKAITATGHPDIIAWNLVMRDELDNAAQLLELLESDGPDVLCRAADGRYEDTFLLGQDVADQLRKKIDIMRAHWRDVEAYLATPLK